MLGKIFETKREEVTGNWRNLHNEELHNLYRSSETISVVKSKRMRWRSVTRMLEIRNGHKIFVGKSIGKETYRINKHA
jgi:uncharacterized lipoprotein